MARRRTCKTLLQKYCPFCFKGKVGVSNGVKVPANSLLIDKLQEVHSRNGNGLNLIDFSEPGEFCENKETCQITCLVCGECVISGEDPFYESLVEYCRDPTDSLLTLFEINDEIEKHDATWTDHWDTPIHDRCAVILDCGCCIPKGGDDCKKHKRRKIQKSTVEKKEPPNKVKEYIPEQAVVEFTESSEGVKHPIRPAKPCLVEKRQAPPPAPKTTIQVEPRVPTSKAKLSLEFSMKPSPSKPSILNQKHEKPKPLSKRKQKLENELKTNDRLDKWMNSSSQPADQVIDTQKKKKTKFNMEEHLERFDPMIHGRFWTKNGYIYKFPDGRVVPVSSDVTELTEDGELRPA